MSKSIDWKKCVGKTVRFIYADIEGIIEITGYDVSKRRLNIEYNGISFEIKALHFASAHIGNIVGTKTTGYTYNVGDIIPNTALRILECTRMRRSKAEIPKLVNIKAYKVECGVCKYINIVSENSVKSNRSKCSCCTGKVVKVGFNDIATTRPDLVKNILNKSDAYRHTQKSNKRIDWVCDVCGNVIENKIIGSISTQGLSCGKCSDGISYPNKFLFNMLSQLGIEFSTEKSFDWCNYLFNGRRIRGRYDFYFESENKKYLLEADGGFHYLEGTRYGKTLDEVKYIDREKERLAHKNNYILIRVDCQKSEKEYIKNNIIKSELNHIFNLRDIDYAECNEFATKSIIKDVCLRYCSAGKDIKRLAKEFKLYELTIKNYIKRGRELGWIPN